MNKRRTPILIPLAVWFLLTLLACSLATSPEPPTLVPQATSTPPPTIGYATLAPNQYPQAATQAGPAAVPNNTTVLNLMNQVDADRMFETISTLVSMKTRRVNSPSDATSGIGAAEAYVLRQFNAVQAQSYQGSFAVTEEPFPINWDNMTSVGTNVIGILSGTDVGAGVIVLGAHYDSINYNFNDPNGYAPGADDDATGIAALLEIARILSQRPHRATIVFVAFSAEEIQRKGSQAFVSDYVKAHNIDVKAMLNMDIIGSNTGPNGAVDDSEIRLFSADPNDSPSRQLARELNLMGARMTPNFSILVQGAVDRAGRYSDHMSFSDAGYPAVRFVEALEEIDREHSERDIIDDIQADYLVKSTQTILACMTALADGPPPPENIDLRQNSDGTRSLHWQPAPGAAGYLVALRHPDGITYSDYFPTSDTSVTWDGFVASRYVSLAIASVDANGLMGPLSIEFGITS